MHKEKILPHQCIYIYIYRDPEDPKLINGSRSEALISWTPLIKVSDLSRKSQTDPLIKEPGQTP